MPSKIFALPVNFPEVVFLNVRCLCYREFEVLVWASPDGPDLEYLDTLIRNSKAEVQLLAQMRRWPMGLGIGFERFAVPALFELTEGHGSLDASNHWVPGSTIS